MGSSPVGVNAADRCKGEQIGQVVGGHVSDRSVAGTLDIAGCDYVPDRYVIGQEKDGFLLYGGGNRLGEGSSQHLPEAVLRMMVEKLSFSGFYRGEASQDQDSGFVVKNWFNFMFHVFHRRVSFLVFFISNGNGFFLRIQGKIFLPCKTRCVNILTYV